MKIEGKRICIRDWDLKDLPEFEKWNQPGQKWQDFDGPYYPRANGEELQKKINNLRKQIEENNFS